MKKIIISFLILLAASCSMEDRSGEVLEVVQFVNKEIEYEESGRIIKSPSQTLEDGTGDCADMSVLVMYYLLDRGINKSRFVIMKGVDKNDSYFLHAVVEYKGVYYDPTLGNILEQKYWDYFDLKVICYLGYVEVTVLRSIMDIII
jgi:hypothetical protein